LQVNKAGEPYAQAQPIPEEERVVIFFIH